MKGFPEEPSPSAFAKERSSYAYRLYDFYNKVVFDGRLPYILSIKWDGRLQKVAGRCGGIEIKSESGVKLFYTIELSSRLLVDGDRLRRTLAHEMCHLADIPARRWKRQVEIFLKTALEMSVWQVTFGDERDAYGYALLADTEEHAHNLARLYMEMKVREHPGPLEWVSGDRGSAVAMWTARRTGEWFGTTCLTEGDEVTITKRIVYGELSEFPRV